VVGKHKKEVICGEKMDTVNDVDVLGQYYHKGRMMVRFKQSFNGRRTILKSNYVWLKNNPSFADIPRGYVIHHLDHDKTNDDPTNLVLMAKSHHTAYHWKQQYEQVKVPFLADSALSEHIFMPIKKPTIHFDKKGDCYCLYFREHTVDGSIRKYVSIHKGQKLKTKAQAEKASQEIWDQANEIRS